MKDRRGAWVRDAALDGHWSCGLGSACSRGTRRLRSPAEQAGRYVLGSQDSYVLAMTGNISLAKEPKELKLLGQVSLAAEVRSVAADTPV